MVETITLKLPGELIAQIKAQVSPTQSELEKFFAEAAQKQLRDMRAKRLQEEYEATHARRSPREMYEVVVAQVAQFEKKYGMASDQFLRRYKSGEIQERDDNWQDLQEWRFAYLGLLRMEEKYSC